jgi:hypothetical protein
MAKVIAHLFVAATAALPVIVALEAIPGSVGKYAAVVAAALVAVLNRAAAPVGK